MKRLHFQFLVCLVLLTVFCGCEETESECGEQTSIILDVVSKNFFNKPADIYWGVTSGVRSYTYNFELGNICTKKNPEVSFFLVLRNSNSGSNNPISANAGIYTCLGVQAHHSTMTPNANQNTYTSDPTEIGMQQCYSGMPSATIYPYITVSFNTLGSSHEDSLYLVREVLIVDTKIVFNVPK